MVRIICMAMSHGEAPGQVMRQSEENYWPESLLWFLWEGMAEAGWAGVSWLVRIILVGSGGIQVLPGGLVSGPTVFRAGG